MKTIKIKDCKIEELSIISLKEILEKKENIIYVEYASSWRMGNKGGILIYLKKENEIICYKTNLYTNQIIYEKCVAFFKENNDSLKNWFYFKYYDGWFGNHVFLNQLKKLKIKKDYFTYKNFKIKSSVIWVFSFIKEQILFCN